MSSAFVSRNAPLLTRRSGEVAQSGWLEKEQTRILHAVHANFAPQLAEALRDLAPVKAITLVSLEETTPERHAARHGQPEHVLTFSSAQPDAGRLEFHGELAGAMLDQLLNCRGTMGHERRQMSEIEVQLLNKTIEPLLDIYAACWRGQATFPVKVQVRAAELAPGEPLYAATYSVTLADGAGQLIVVLRLSACVEALGPATAPSHKVSTMPARNLGLLGVIGDTTLCARTLLGNTRISIAEFLDLRVGDVICLEQDADAPVEIRVGNQARLRGEARIHNGRYLVTITDIAARGGE